MIIVRAPLRVSFFGGGTDHPEWFMNSGPGGVVSTAIDKYVYIQLRKLPKIFPFKYRVVWREVEQVSDVKEIRHPVVRAILSQFEAIDPSGYEIVYNADLPARSGLGSSSAFTVSCLQAFFANLGRYMSPHDLSLEAIHVERELLHEPVGCQDQVAIAYGGLNRIEFLPNGRFEVCPVALLPDRRRRLEASLMLFFTGFTRDAGGIEQEKKQNFENKKAELARMYVMVGEGVRILEDAAASIDDFGLLLHEAWMLKRSLASAVSSSSIDHIYDRALAAGALGGKLLGAGGGGFMLFYVPPDSQESVKHALSDLVYVPFQFDLGGSRILMFAPDITTKCVPAVNRLANAEGHSLQSVFSGD